MMPDLKIDQADLNEIAALVYQSCGIVFKDSNLSVLTSRLSNKLKENQVNSNEYVKKLKEEPLELRSFIGFVTTNFTSFFRTPRQFDILRENALPEIIRKNSEEKLIRIWSAGCATGEEPYTLAMVLNEFLEQNSLLVKGWDYSITASDISLNSLFTAKEGKYPAEGVKKMSPYYLNKYFKELSGEYLVSDSIKKKICFDYHNLIYDNGIREMDIVFCRNVLIYFDADIQTRVLLNIHQAMKEKSFFFIGHSESLFGLFKDFSPMTTEKGIVYVK
jgi:chemotaxis protein methyltransferase CheR